MAKKNLPAIDYSQPMFFVEQLRQSGYDREIDEGMSSGMKRYATLDVTSLSGEQVTGFLEKLLSAVEDFRLCKVVQVAGFNKDDRRYLTVSGESHAMYPGSAKESMLDRIRPVIGGLPVGYVQAHITPPVQGKPYAPVNLGPYGSTGAPGFGVLQHPDAQRLRDQGEIR